MARPKKKDDAPAKDFVFDPDNFHADVDELADMAESLSERNGELRAAIKEKLESRGYHKTALAMARRIAAMSPEKFADFMRSFDPMLDAIVDRRNAGTTPDMFDGQPAEIIQHPSSAAPKKRGRKPKGSGGSEASAAE